MSITYDENNVPYIHGVPCRKKEIEEVFQDIFSSWICPHCDCPLSTSMICLNGCHLTGAGLRKFQSMMTQAVTAGQDPRDLSSLIDKTVNVSELKRS